MLISMNRLLSYTFSWTLLLVGIFCIPAFSYGASGKLVIETLRTWSSSGDTRASEVRYMSSWSSLDEKDDKKENTNTGNTDDEYTKNGEEERVKQDINEGLIEVYIIPKAKKAINDLVASLSKKYPDPKDRVTAYEKIKSSLTLKRKKINNETTGELRKLFIITFIDTSLDLLTKRIDELK